MHSLACFLLVHCQQDRSVRSPIRNAHRNKVDIKYSKRINELKYIKCELRTNDCYLYKFQLEEDITFYFDCGLICYKDMWLCTG